MGAAMTKAASAYSHAHVLSSRASDSGTIAFTQHTGYPQAMKDNRAAWGAWDAAGRAAKGVLSLPPVSLEISADQARAAEWVSDAKDRMGELDVALAALREDMRQNMKLKVKRVAQNESAVTTAPLLRGAFADMTTREKGWTLGLIAAGVGLAAKVLGAW